MDSDVVASQLEHRTELLIPPGSSTEGTSGDEVLETPIVQSPSTFSDSGTEGTNQSRGPELSLDEFVKRRSLIIHAVHVHGIHKLMDGQYPGLQIEIQMDGWAGRRSEVVCSENPIWKLNKVLTDVDASSIVTIILYRRVSHKERSVDLILATAQQPVAQLSWLPTYLSYVADSGPSTSNQISLVLGCTMRPLLNDNIVKEFTSEYNVLAEQAKTEFVLPPEIEGSPVTLLRTIFSSPERGRFLGRFHKPRLCIEFLDQFLIMMNPDDRLYRTVLHSLRRLCAKYASLPTSFRVSHKKLTKHERVTGGGFGDVYKGQHKNRDVCLKTMAKNRASSFDMSQALKVVCREAIAWKYLDHRNIIMLLGVNVSLISDNLCLISPWMEHGDIRAYLKNNPATNRLQLLVDIACGLEYLHSLDLVHADLKGANVLIDDEKRALLTDFGLATVAYELNTVNSTSSISKGGGTMAPELFDPGRFGIKGPPQPRKASDMYSLSMLMWEIFTGRYPLHEYFTDSLIRDAVLSEKRPQRPPHTTAFGLSDVVWGIMAACWTHDPFQRPKVNDISSRLYDAYVDYAPESVSEEEMKKAIHLFGKDGTEADISMVSTTITI